MDHLTIYAHVLKHTYAYTSNALQECGGKVTAKKLKAIYKSLMSTYHAVTQARHVCLHAVMGGVEIYTVEPRDTSSPTRTVDTTLEH